MGRYRDYPIPRISRRRREVTIKSRSTTVSYLPWIELCALSDPRCCSKKPQPATRSVSFVPETDTRLTGLAEEATPAQSSSEHIEDFCSALCASDRDDREIGLLIDEANDKQHHMLYRANTFVGSQISSRSLEDLLTSQRRSGNEDLSRKDRLQIAVILASSVLQLDGTSWLKTGWSSVDIFFHYKDGQISEHTYPYLAWQRCCDTDVASSFESLSVTNPMIQSDVLLALGLTLVELCWGRTLANMRKQEDKDASETASRLKTAMRLRHGVYDEMGIPYGDVVRRCLLQSFDVRELSLDIEEVQQMVLDHVVTPLVDDLKNFNGYLKIRWTNVYRRLRQPLQKPHSNINSVKEQPIYASWNPNTIIRKPEWK